MDGDWPIIIGNIVVSLIVIPTGLLAILSGADPAGGVDIAVLGAVSMVPGVLMGATAAWVSARG